MTGNTNPDYLVAQEQATSRLIQGDDRSNQQSNNPAAVQEERAKPIEVRSKELLTSSNNQESSTQRPEWVIKINKKNRIKGRTVVSS